MTNKQKRFFKHAKAASEMSNFPKVHIGCVITCGNKIVGVGFNSRKSSPMQKKYNQYRDFEIDDLNVEPLHLTHAETMAIRQLKYSGVDPNKCEVWVYREYKDGSPAMAKPCSGCMKMFKDLGIKIANYTTNEGYATEEIID